MRFLDSSSKHIVPGNNLNWFKLMQHVQFGVWCIEWTRRLYRKLTLHRNMSRHEDFICWLIFPLTPHLQCDFFSHFFWLNRLKFCHWVPDRVKDNFTKTLQSCWEHHQVFLCLHERLSRKLISPWRAKQKLHWEKEKKESRLPPQNVRIKT